MTVLSLKIVMDLANNIDSERLHILQLREDFIFLPFGIMAEGAGGSYLYNDIVQMCRPISPLF